MKIISLMGYSGSGKTQFILQAISHLKKKFNYEVAVIKNIHEHRIDKEGKDSYMYAERGAKFAITKNVYNETTIFIKSQFSIRELIDWLGNSPFKIDIIFTEGFRDLDYPSILCLKNVEELESQLSNTIRAISGLISLTNKKEELNLNYPIIDIEYDFEKFIRIFEII